MTDVMPEQLVDLDELTGGEITPANTTGLDAVDEQLIAQLAGRARAGGLQLAGEGGLLAQLTKRLVESALEGELTDHLGYGRHDATGQLRVGAEDRRAVRGVDGDDDPRDQVGDAGGAEDQRKRYGDDSDDPGRCAGARPATGQSERDAAPGARRGVLTQQQLADAANAPGDGRAAGGGAAAAQGGKRVEDRVGVALARVPRNSAGLAAGDNRGHSLGEQKASKALPSAVAWAGSVGAGGASCQAAARRLREVGDVVIVEDPEAGLGVESLYQVRERERRLRAHVTTNHWPRSAAARARRDPRTHHRDGTPGHLPGLRRHPAPPPRRAPQFIASASRPIQPPAPGLTPQQPFRETWDHREHRCNSDQEAVLDLDARCSAIKASPEASERATPASPRGQPMRWSAVAPRPGRLPQGRAVRRIGRDELAAYRPP